MHSEIKIIIFKIKNIKEGTLVIQKNKNKQQEQ